MATDIESAVFIPDELRAQKAALDGGGKPRATVRELLGWFNAARRGNHVVHRVRAALEALGLFTWPDFEGEYIDQEVFFMHKSSGLTATNTTTTTTTSTTTTTPPPTTEGAPPTASSVGPSHRLGRLKAANRKPLGVSPSESLQAATTLMLTHDFSQLPVMQGDRTVKGIITWESIGSRLALGKDCRTVQDCMEQHYELRYDDSLFEAVRVIAEHDCVLVRDRETKITGLVTGADISEQFHLLAEPFLLLGDIENRIRALIVPRFTAADLAAAKDPSDNARPVTDASDLTFGEYVRLLENEGRWQKLGLKIDRRMFTEQLRRIRDIRNDVMHFDPDGITPEELDDLRRFSVFLERLQRVTD